MLRRCTGFLLRHRPAVVLAVLLLSVLAATQVRNLRIVIDPVTALPQQHPYVVATDLVDRVFGTNAMLVIALLPRDGDVFQPGLLAEVKRITDGLPAIPGVRADTVMSLSAGRAKAITGQPDGVDVEPLMAVPPRSAEAMERLRRMLAGNPLYRDSLVAGDGRAVAITATLEKGDKGFRDGMDRVHALVEPARSAAVDVAVSGFPMYLAQLEMYSQRMMLLFPLAVLVVGLLHFEAFRTLQGFALPLVTALLSVTWGLGAMGLAGVPMDAFNAVTPILILAVTAGHAVQLLKRYYEEYDRLAALGHAPAEANRLAVMASVETVGPVMLAAGLVAAASFFSLTGSDIATIRSFGAVTGLGILSGLVIEFTLIPVLRSWLPPPPRPTRGRRGPWDRVTGRVARLVTGRHRWAGVALPVAAAALVGSGIASISLDNSTRSYFAPDLPFQQEDRAINARLGGTNTLSVMVEGDRDDLMKEPEILRLLDGTQAFLDAQPGVGKTLSLADAVKRLNQAMNGDDPAFAVIPDSRDLVAQYLLLYSMSGGPTDFDRYVDTRYRSAVITAYLKDDGSAFIDGLIGRLNAHLARHADPRITVRIGGSVPETAALAQVLVDGKLHNIAQMAAVVFLVSALIFRSLLAGALVLAPLVITVVVNYGTMGLTGMPLNTPNSISAALGIGIGADYAIYLLYRIREALGGGDPHGGDPCGGDLAEAVRSALHSAGKAILYVGSAIAGGYSVLLLSQGFNIHLWFGALIVLSMVVSVASALVLVPSLVMALRPRFLRRGAAAGGRVPAAAALLLALAALLAGAGEARAGEEGGEADARALMERNYAATRFADSTGDGTMTLVDRDGARRVRGLTTMTRLGADGVDNKRLVRFQSPADIRNTVILTVEHAGAEDEMLIYLPALKKIRRLASADKKDAFVGSDLSYGDVIGHRVADWRHRLLRREPCGEGTCAVVESLPADDAAASRSGYSRRVNWIDGATALAVRTEFFDTDGRLLKVGRQGRPQAVDAARGQWQPMHTEIANVQTGHTTILEYDRFQANQGIDDGLFSTRSMERPE